MIKKIFKAGTHLIRNTIRSQRRVLCAKREAENAFSDINNPPVIIYQMGKVGSITISTSLKESSLVNPVLNMHFLSAELSRITKYIKKTGVYPFPHHIYIGKATQRELEKHPNFPIKIITLVRDPIAFVVSGLFQNPYFVKENIKTMDGRMDSTKIIDYLGRKLREPDTFDYIYTWFDKELKTVFDIDVFEKPFPVETGIGHYQKDNIQVLLIRLEDLSDIGTKAIAEFLDMDAQLILKKANVRAELNESDAYLEVLNNLSVDPDLCREIYSSRYVRHFYNEEMINKFISRWTSVS